MYLVLKARACQSARIKLTRLRQIGVTLFVTQRRLYTGSRSVQLVKV